MKKVILISFCFVLISCFKEPKKNTSVEIPIENVTSETNNERLTVPKKHNESRYLYIKSFKGKYPSDVSLFEKGILKTQLMNLLGEENYNLFIQNMSVQIPIDIIYDEGDEYAFISGGAPHSFGSDEACIEIDFKNDKISVGILSEANNVFYFTENEDKSQSLAKDKLATWLYEAKENIYNQLKETKTPN